MKSMYAVASAIALAIVETSCGSKTITGGLEPPPVSISVEVDSLTVTVPSTANVAVTLNHAVSCTSSWAGAIAKTSASYPVPITSVGSFLFVVTCTGEDGKSKSAQVTVTGKAPPVMIMSVQIVGAQPAFEQIPTGMQVKVERGSIVQMVDFDLSGKASFVHANEDSLCITIDATNPSLREYSPTRRTCVKRENFSKEQIFVLIPFVWEGGNVDLAEALDTTGTWPTSAGRSFYYLDTRPLGILLTSKTWPESRLPIPVAYNRGASTTDISQAESDSVGAIINRLNLELGKSRTGKNFFKYGAFADLNPQGNLYEGIPLVVDSTDQIGASWNESRSSGFSLISGFVKMRIVSGLLHECGLTHELLHGLGAGHTQRWLSIMNNNPLNCGAINNKPTPKDILYTRLLHRVREVQLKYNAQYP